MMMKRTPPATPPAMAGVEDGLLGAEPPNKVPALTHLAD